MVCYLVILNYGKMVSKFDDDNIEYGCANNYINELGEYEVYIFVSSKNVVASNLLPYTTNSRTAAEAKYNAEMAKINRKEKMLDMQMKQLDTEYQALSSELESVKSIISNHASKDFELFS